MFLTKMNSTYLPTCRNTISKIIYNNISSNIFFLCIMYTIIIIYCNMYIIVQDISLKYIIIIVSTYQPAYRIFYWTSNEWARIQYNNDIHVFPF